MNAPARLGLYGTGLAALFAAAFVVGGAVVPESAVADWSAVETGDADHADPTPTSTH